ncbi:MAG: NAD(P)-binding domain-containing protein [Myxococcaceae bacterium]|nr:NAD(P)-binding domain-containing protein [Myxococcaceae bacterium]
MGFDTAGLLGLFAAGLAALFAYRWARLRREAADTAAFEQAVAENRHIPQTLHPVIDPDRCIGSFSCLRVCPEGDILGAIAGKAALIDGSSCIGHGKCAVECPVDAIKLVFGTSERGVDLPEVDEFFETRRAGVHVVGELGGMGLIKNAITQGLQCAQRLGEVLEKSERAGTVDVAIVGAGPAGMATALGLKHAGRTFRLLEQETVGGTISHYPRQKVVMTERVTLPFYGKFGKPLISKEELLEMWSEALESGGVEVETDTRVMNIAGADGAFSLETNRGQVSARKVVLAIGRHGTPRRLGVPGENLAKVTYRMIDAQQYEGSRVLVVGGGDSALEAAIQLVEETEAEVALSYRQPDLAKCREANKRRFRELVAQGRIHAFMPSQVTAVTPREVLLSTQGEVRRLANDFVIACIGGELPAKWLEQNAVPMKRFHGEQRGRARARAGSAGDVDAKGRNLALGLFTFGVMVVALLLVFGWHYYALPMALRPEAPAHALLRPAGTIGHGIGIVSTLVMMSNFVYAVRKRVRALKGAGSIRNWLTFHQFVGFLSPAVIVFHAAFQSNNLLATSTAGALGVVVLTGAIGRYVFSLVPSSEGRAEELGELTARFERLKVRLAKLGGETTEAGAARQLLDDAAMPATGSLLAQLVRLPFEQLQAGRRLARVKHLFKTQGHFLDFAQAYRRVGSLRVQVGFFARLKRLMSVWRLLHVVLAVLLVVLIVAHISVSVFLGYTWLFR